MGVAAATEHHSVAFEHEFSTVIDVGANRGQFSLFAARRFPAAELHCFEPLPEALEVLTSTLSAHRRLRVYRVALGASGGTGTFNVATSDDSSSLLTATGTQTASFPKAEVAERRPVEVARLDDVLFPAELSRPCLLKVEGLRVRGSARRRDVARRGRRVAHRVLVRRTLPRAAARGRDRRLLRRERLSPRGESSRSCAMGEGGAFRVISCSCARVSVRALLRRRRTPSIDRKTAGTVGWCARRVGFVFLLGYGRPVQRCRPSKGRPES